MIRSPHRPLSVTISPLSFLPLWTPTLNCRVHIRNIAHGPSQDISQDIPDARPQKRTMPRLYMRRAAPHQNRSCYLSGTCSMTTSWEGLVLWEHNPRTSRRMTRSRSLLHAPSLFHPMKGHCPRCHLRGRGRISRMVTSDQMVWKTRDSGWANPARQAEGELSCAPHRLLLIVECILHLPSRQPFTD